MSYPLGSVSLVALSLVASASSSYALPQSEPKQEHKTITIEGEGIHVGGPSAQNDRVATDASQAEGQGPGLEISGGSSFNAYAFKQRQRESGNGFGRGTHFGVDSSRINFEVLGKAGPRLDGLEYSFLIGFTGNTATGKNTVSENRVQFKHRYGTVRAGGHRGVTDFMSVGAFVFHAGTGNVLGNHGNVIVPTTGVVVKDDPAGHAKNQTKITYVTPRFAGVQAGYSFTPDGKHEGESKLATKAVKESGVVKPAGQHLHEFGLNFKKEAMAGLDVQLSATGIVGKAKNTERLIQYGHKDVGSYALGFVMTYAGFSLGGEYLNNGKSLEWKGLKDNDAGRVYNVGLGYATGRHAVSLGYLYSKRKLGKSLVDGTDYGKTTAKIGALSYDYKVAKGLKMYAEGVAFNYKTSSENQAASWNTATTGASASAATGSNQGHAVMLGTAISF